MSALKSWHRATLIVVMGGLALAGLAWIVLTDPAVNYLPRHRDADWIVFPAAIDARAHSYASLDATSRREFVLPHKATNDEDAQQQRPHRCHGKRKLCAAVGAVP